MEIKKITEGITGQEAADIINTNSALLIKSTITDNSGLIIKISDNIIVRNFIQQKFEIGKKYNIYIAFEEEISTNVKVLLSLFTVNSKGSTTHIEDIKEIFNPNTFHAQVFEFTPTLPANYLCIYTNIKSPTFLYATIIDPALSVLSSLVYSSNEKGGIVYIKDTQRIYSSAINYQTGIVQSSTSAFYCKVSINKNYKYIEVPRFISKGVAGLAFFDNTDNYISGFGSISQNIEDSGKDRLTVPLPENAIYMLYTYYLDSFCLERDIIPFSYFQFSNSNNANIVLDANTNAGIIYALENNRIIGKTVNAATGEILDNSHCFILKINNTLGYKYIDLPIYYTSASNGVAFFSADDMFINGAFSTGTLNQSNKGRVIFDIPTNTSYLLCSCISDGYADTNKLPRFDFGRLLFNKPSNNSNNEILTPNYIGFSDSGNIFPIFKRFKIKAGGNGCVAIDTINKRYYFNNNKSEANDSTFTITDLSGNTLYSGRIEGDPVMHPNDSELYNNLLYICDTGMNDKSTSPTIKIIDTDNKKLIETIQMPYAEDYRAASVSIKNKGIAYISMVQSIPNAQRQHIRILEFDLNKDRTIENYTPLDSVINIHEIPNSRYYCQGSTIIGKFLFITENSGKNDSILTKIDLSTFSISEHIDLGGLAETQGMLHYFTNGKTIIEVQDVNAQLFYIEL